MVSSLLYNLSLEDAVQQILQYFIIVPNHLDICLNFKVFLISMKFSTPYKISITTFARFRFSCNYRRVIIKDNANGNNNVFNVNGLKSTSLARTTC